MPAATLQPLKTAMPKHAEPHLSASQIRTYATCSLQWRFQRHCMPEFVSSALVFGSAFHVAVQICYQARLEGREAARDQMLHAFGKAFTDQPLPIQYGKNETAEGLMELAGRMVDAFLASLHDSTVIAVEEPFECHLADGLPPLAGYIDLIEIRKGADGVKRLHLVDFKTAGRKPSDDDVDPDQLTLYAIASHRIGLLRQFNLPLSLRYDIVTKVKSPEVMSVPVTPTKQDAYRLIEKAKVCWRGMQEGICFPNPSWMCAGCGHQRRCQQWPHLKELKP